MRFCGVAFADVILGFFMVVLMTAGPVLAEDAKTDTQPQIYNTPATAGKSGTKPIFLQAATEQPAGMKTSTPYTADTKTDGAMTEADYEALAKKIEADDNQQQASRVAAIQAQYEATKAQEEAAAAAARQQYDQAGGGGQADTAAATQGDSANPYAGKTVVFTGAKKDNNKPVRLFNVK